MRASQPGGMAEALHRAAAARPRHGRDPAQAPAGTHDLLRTRLQWLRVGGLLQRGGLLAGRGFASAAGMKFREQIFWRPYE